jgi:anti-sigma regulatory factor (Ser/Thr protein kinase)
VIPAIDAAAGLVRDDPSRLQQIVWNLLSNAVKFTPKSGRVELLVQRVESHVQISVSDTGMGIPPEFLPHVFERFRQADASTTRQHGGLGLGLSIVKQLTELHGGSVEAQKSGEGKGATFTITIPVASAPLPRARIPSLLLSRRSTKSRSPACASCSWRTIPACATDHPHPAASAAPAVSPAASAAEALDAFDAVASHPDQRHRHARPGRLQPDRPRETTSRLRQRRPEGPRRRLNGGSLDRTTAAARYQPAFRFTSPSRWKRMKLVAVVARADNRSPAGSKPL